MLILSILHVIHLTSDQIEKLCEGKDIEVTGASLPVWYFRGSTSEPAEEVFCKYTLTNKKIDSMFLMSVRGLNDGYKINMPQLPSDYVPPKSLTDETWRKMTLEDQANWYKKDPIPTTAKNLLPIQEGGAGYLHIKEENGKVLMKNKYIATIHVVEIKRMELLIDSFN